MGRSAREILGLECDDSCGCHTDYTDCGVRSDTICENCSKRASLSVKIAENKFIEHTTHLKNIKTLSVVPIKIALEKVISQHGSSLRSWILEYFAEILEIKMVRRRYYCSREKLEAADFRILLDLGAQSCWKHSLIQKE